jgi:exportin-2 (importin alpha re-exporter)
MTLFTRMQSSKTETYTYLFSRFLLYIFAVNVEGLSPDMLISTVEGIQPQ